MNKPALMIEVKWSDSDRSPNFSFFGKHFDEVRKIQVVKELRQGKNLSGRHTNPNSSKLVIGSQSCLKSRKRKAHYWINRHPTEEQWN